MEEKSGWIEQTDDGHLKKKKRGVCLTHSARSRAVLAGRFLILGAQFFVVHLAADLHGFREAFGACCGRGTPQRSQFNGQKHIHVQ